MYDTYCFTYVLRADVQRDTLQGRDHHHFGGNQNLSRLSTQLYRIQKNGGSPVRDSQKTYSGLIKKVRQHLLRNFQPRTLPKPLQVDQVSPLACLALLPSKAGVKVTWPCLGRDGICEAVTQTDSETTTPGAVKLSSQPQHDCTRHMLPCTRQLHLTGISCINAAPQRVMICFCILRMALFQSAAQVSLP